MSNMQVYVEYSKPANVMSNIQVCVEDRQTANVMSNIQVCVEYRQPANVSNIQVFMECRHLSKCVLNARVGEHELCAQKEGSLAI